MITIIDYGTGNLRSVQKAFERVGAAACITDRPEDIRSAQKLVLPGVGAIKPAMQRLETLGLVTPITDFIRSGRPFLGICLGLQLLFEQSEEGGEVATLAVLPGKVKRFTGLKVPHMGWNDIEIQKPGCPVFQGIKSLTPYYFCHSFFVAPTDPSIIATTTQYGGAFASAVWKDNVFALQFHPEKSQKDGLAILKNFCRIKI